MAVVVAEFLTELCLESYLRSFVPGTTMETLRSMPICQMMALGIPRGHAVRITNLACHWERGNTAVDATLGLGLRGKRSKAFDEPKRPPTDAGLSSFTRRLATLHISEDEEELKLSVAKSIPVIPQAWASHREAKQKGQARKR